MMAAMMTGNFVFGAVNARLARHGVTTLQAALAIMAAMIGAQSLILLGILPFSLPLWCVAGFCASGPIAMFAVLSTRFPADLAGRSNTALNLLGFLAGFFLQSGIGLILDQFPVAADGGYSAEGHRIALGMTISIQIAAFAWFFLAKGLDRPDRATLTEAKDEA